ncbi:adenosylhomocysteine nucleosidase [Lacibacter cauensis]|uniref:Adenosylhomocysteine nucleosidase n=1 Tax=Lacibacter cauensis TaxID=510947 RepID=A0A562SK79_9BACT|nr:5'-methylthioadenosine/S-adenosylhomocysteine nucleosidase [Lacibacter cauensis]TWI81659.1 adenosylhomocysteine nucleosidase [Lacibacter cauensis]
MASALSVQHQLPLQDALFVFALESEAAEDFTDCNVLITGIGKVSAAYALTKSIAQHKPAMIINLGSAGSNTFSKGTIVCCTQFIQRDMDVRGLGFQLYETPLSGIDPVLQYGLQIKGLPQGICGTGDSFEMNHDVIAYTVVDMEAYPLALIAQKENIPFLCLKYISDGADGSAADDWNELVHKAAVAFRTLLFGDMQ